MFFSSSKKMTLINEANKNTVLMMIQNELESCEDDKFRQELRDMFSTIKKQPVSDSTELFDCYAKVRKYLEGIGDDLSKKYYRVARFRLDKLKGIVSDLARCAAKGNTSYLDKGYNKGEGLARKKMEKYLRKDAFNDVVANFKPEELYTEDDETLMDQYSIQDCCDLEQKKLLELVEAQKKNPYDRTIATSIEQCKQRINGYGNTLKTYGVEIIHITIEDSIKKNKEVKEQLLERRPQSKDETMILINDAKDVNQKYNDATLTPEKYNELMGGDGLTSDSQAQNLAADANVGTEGRSVFGNYTPTGDPFIDNFFLEQALKEQRERLEAAIEQAKRDIDNLQSKVQECDEGLNEIDEKLKPLLTERRGLSPTRRLSIDSRIDIGYAERNNKIRKIKDFVQRISILRSHQGVFDEKLRIYEREEQEKSCIFTPEEIRAMAQEVDRSVKDYNQKLEDANDAYVVAHSTDIQWGTAGGISQTESASEYSDDEKYADLEKELGLEFPKKH